MAVIQVELLNGTTADANDVMDNFDEIYDNIDSSNVQAANKTGTGAFVLQTSPSVLGGLTLNSGTDLKVYSDVATTLKFQVDGATGAVGTTSGQKVFLDGAALTGNTSLRESSADVIMAEAGGNDSFSVSAAGIGVVATGQVFLDGVSQAGNTSWRESAADVITGKAGGTDAISIRAGSIAIPSTSKFYFDGIGAAGDDYIYSPSNASVLIVAGGVGSLEVTNTLLDSAVAIRPPDIDPPVANTMTRNSGVKAWADVSSTGSEVASYNVSATSRTTDPGRYSVTWDTDFSSVDYAIMASANRNGGLGGAPFVANWTEAGVAAGSITIGVDRTTDNTAQNSEFHVLAVGSQ